MSKAAIVNYVFPPKKEKLIDISWQQFYYSLPWVQ